MGFLCWRWLTHNLRGYRGADRGGYCMGHNDYGSKGVVIYSRCFFDSNG